MGNPKEINMGAGIEYLKNTGDPMLLALAELIEEDNKMPNEEELVILLEFFLTFSQGCRGLELLEIADRFNSRAENFKTTLNKWGMQSGKYRNVVRKSWEPVTYNRIVNKAEVIAAYKIAGSVNKY